MSETFQQEELTSGNPRKAITAGIIIVVLFFGGFGAFASFFPYSGAVIAPGVVKISMERKAVQHLEGGIIDKILVQEGDRVEKGQVLVRLKSSEVDANVSILQGQLWFKMAQASRLKAESMNADAIEWPEKLIALKDDPKMAKILQEEKAVFQSNKRDLLGKMELYNSQIGQMEEKIIGAREEMAAQEEIVRTLEEELAAKEELFEERYIDKAQLLVIQRNIAERKGQAGALRQVIAEAGQKIEELKLRIIDLRNQYQQTANVKLSEIGDQVFGLQEKLKPNRDQKERLEIKAPVAGEIFNLQVHSEEGGVIRPGETVLEIVPNDAKLIIETQMLLQDITKVHEGQHANIQLTAFNRRDTPPIKGSVSYISGDKLSHETMSGTSSYYLAHVEVDETSLKESGAYLSPGMPAVCYITTETRTILKYLLDPLLENFDRALRESD